MIHERQDHREFTKDLAKTWDHLSHDQRPGGGNVRPGKVLDAPESRN